MKPMLFLSLILCLLLAPPDGLAQSSQVIPITAKTDVKRLLFNYLVKTKQAIEADEYNSMFQTELLKPGNIPSNPITIYKFGISSPHAGFNIAFRYKEKLVFPKSVTSGPLLALLGDFITQYPNRFSLVQQKQLASLLIDVAEHQAVLAKEDF